MRYFVVVLFLVLPLATASASDVTKELVSYNTVAVGFSKNAAKCNLKEKAILEEYLVQKLDEMGLKENPNSQVVVRLNVAGTTLGLLGAQCATYTGLQIQTRLRAENIVTDNPTVRAAVDRLEEFPILLWTHGAFSVTTLPEPSAGGESLEAYNAVKQNLDVIVERYKEQKAQ